VIERAEPVAGESAGAKAGALLIGETLDDVAHGAGEHLRRDRVLALLL
jgi:hypothetical protein